MTDPTTPRDAAPDWGVLARYFAGESPADEARTVTGWLAEPPADATLLQRLDEVVRAGATQQWELQNLGGPMGMRQAHPIHLHGRQFRVVARSGGRTGDDALRAGLVDGGWLDTVLVLPDERVRIQTTFTDHPGRYLYHCHILEHEDMGMMRNFEVVAE